MKKTEDYDKVKIRPFSSMDLTLILKLYQDKQFMYEYGDIPDSEKTYPSLFKWYDDLLEEGQSELFVIEEAGNETMIGFVQLDDINYLDESTWISIGIDPTFQNKGYGKLTMQWMIREVFKRRKFKLIRLGVFAHNVRAIHIYKSLGFQIEHVIPTAKYSFRKESDVYQMILLNHGYERR